MMIDDDVLHDTSVDGDTLSVPDMCSDVTRETHTLTYNNLVEDESSP